jgi:urocanate hydratase
LAKSQQRNCIDRLLGNVVDVWEKFDEKDIHIDLGSDQTSYIIRTGGYPTDISFEDANAMMAETYIQRKGTGNITPSHHRYQ